MSLPLTHAPESVCILRLSAVGDICHTLPVVRTIQHVWPDTHITWVIGKLEHTLVADIPGIEFVVFDKAQGFTAYRNLYRQMRGRHFDVLLHMQMALRASVASRLIPAKIRLGFDRKRAKDLQWLFTNEQIVPLGRQHVMDSFFGFSEALGIKQHNLEWDIPIPEQARAKVRGYLADVDNYLVISPCSSMSYRNWNSEGYAAVADYAADEYGLKAVVTGGPSDIEQRYGEEISQSTRSEVINLVGKTNLKELLAVLDGAKLVIAPDSGPAHMATAVNTSVIGLYACTNPERARPYFSQDYTVNRYDEAVWDKHHKTPAELPWGLRIRDAGTMSRISVTDVTDMLDKFMRSA